MSSRRLPAEWEPHSACWMAWPHLREEWPDHFEQAREELLGLARAIANEGGEVVRLLVRSDDDREELALRLADELRAERIALEPMAFGDAWTRDTLPFFVEEHGELRSVCYRFDGWGGKYPMDGDLDLSGRVAGSLGFPTESRDLVLEGGAIEVDGRGFGLTTEDAVFARNAPRDWAEIEREVCEGLGLSKLVMLRGCLLNDHTDGHIDNLARLCPGGKVVTARAGADDPNHDTWLKIHVQLEYMIEDHALDLEIRTLPSPGAVHGSDGALMPANYLNFTIANRAVLVPAFGVDTDEQAREVLAQLFEDRKVVSIPARHILSGGGGPHCVTHQQPECP